MHSDRLSWFNCHQFSICNKNIIAFDLQSVEEARVGNIVTTLKAHSQHYALVIENENNQHIIRGLFNTSQISRQLHHEIASIKNNGTT